MSLTLMKMYLILSTTVFINVPQKGTFSFPRKRIVPIHLYTPLKNPLQFLLYYLTFFNFLLLFTVMYYISVS